MKIILDKSLYTLLIISLGLIARRGIADSKGMHLKISLPVAKLPCPSLCQIVRQPSPITQVGAVPLPAGPSEAEQCLTTGVTGVRSIARYFAFLELNLYMYLYCT